MFIFQIIYIKKITLYILKIISSVQKDLSQDEEDQFHSKEEKSIWLYPLALQCEAREVHILGLNQQVKNGVHL